MTGNPSLLRLFVLACTLVPAHAAIAASSDAAQRGQLETLEQQLDQTKSRQNALKDELSALDRETAEISTRMISLAAEVQARESKVTSTEAGIAKLDGEQAGLAAKLARQRDTISKLLASLQTLKRNPPPPLATRPDDAVGAVRSAMLFAAVVSTLKRQAGILTRDLARLENLRAATAREHSALKAYIDKLNDTRQQMRTLHSRKLALTAQTTDELKKERKRAKQLALRAKSLKQLLAALQRERDKIEQERLRKAEAAQRKAEAEKRKAEAEQRKAEARQRKAEREQRKAEAQKRKAEAEASKAHAQQLTAQAERLKARARQRKTDAENRQPRIKFSKAKGRLAFPAQGKRLTRFGQQTAVAGTAQGLYLGTRRLAQVTTPAAGRVEFAGPFRSYGQLLILNVGEGYHVLLAGLGDITAKTGQHLRAGEPVGLMGTNPARGTLIGDHMEYQGPVLYIEFRKNGGAIDPSSWWVGNRKEARQ